MSKAQSGDSSAPCDVELGLLGGIELAKGLAVWRMKIASLTCLVH